MQGLDRDALPELVDRFVGGDADDKHAEKCNRGMHRSEAFQQAQLKPIDEPAPLVRQFERRSSGSEAGKRKGALP